MSGFGSTVTVLIACAIVLLGCILVAVCKKPVESHEENKEQVSSIQSSLFGTRYLLERLVKRFDAIESNQSSVKRTVEEIYMTQLRGLPPPGKSIPESHLDVAKMALDQGNTRTALREIIEYLEDTRK